MRISDWSSDVCSSDLRDVASLYIAVHHDPWGNIVLSADLPVDGRLALSERERSRRALAGRSQSIARDATTGGQTKFVGQRICGRGETAITDPCLVEVSQNRNANEISKRFRQHGERDTVIIMRAIAQPEAARAQFHWADCLVPAQFLRVLLLGDRKSTV